MDPLKKNIQQPDESFEFGLPKTTVDSITRPFIHFMHIEAAGGFILLLATAIALVAANSNLSEAYNHFWHIPLGFNIGSWRLEHSLAHWINDALMTIFFFVVGLEIKREIIFGEFKDKRAAILPLAAAAGGMLVPAMIYRLLLGSDLGSSGWGIPMATDIAFVIGFLSLLGPRVPHSLKIFILSLAIVDDIGAVLVIAIFYSQSLSIDALMMAAGVLALVVAVNYLGVRSMYVYVALGALVWFFVLKAGIHPTVAGVALGLLTPASAWLGDPKMRQALADIFQRAHRDPAVSHKHLNLAVTIARESISPLQRLELALHPWVAFVIMPLFALANAAVVLNGSVLFSEISVAVALGLFLGKPLGIMLFTAFAVFVLKAKFPVGITWSAIFGASALAGIGFTMSIFIAGLALPADLLDAGKAGTLIGSMASCLLGMGVLYWVLPTPQNSLLNPSSTH